MSTPQDLSTVIGYPVEYELTATYSSSSSTFLQPGGVSTLPPIQPTKENYFLWKSVFTSVLRASDMLDLAEGREQCPPQTQTLAYTNWIKRDQTLLTWINSSFSVSLLGNTTGFTSGRALWSHLDKLLGDQAMNHVNELRFRLRNLDMTALPAIEEEKEQPYKFTVKRYLEIAKEIADGLETAGSPVDDTEFVSCVLNGLPRSYEGYLASIRDRPEPLTRKELEKSLPTHQPKSLEIVAILLALLMLTLLVYVVVGGVFYIGPLVLGFCVLAALVWHCVLSSSKARTSDQCGYMKLHTESV